MASTVNNETIQRLTLEVGKDTVLMLFEVFSAELKDYFEQLSGSPSISQIREISHALKSSAASFGADELAELARECEYRVKLGQNAWVQAQLPHFAKIVQGTACEYIALASQKDLINH